MLLHRRYEADVKELGMDVRRQIGWALLLAPALLLAIGALLCAQAAAQTPPPPPPPDQPPPPLVIGRDAREPGEMIGKGFLLKVWLSDVGGVGVQELRAVRRAPDG